MNTTIFNTSLQRMGLYGKVKSIREQNYLHSHSDNKKTLFFDYIYDFNEKGNLQRKMYLLGRSKRTYEYNEANELIKTRLFTPYEWMISENSYEILNSLKIKKEIRQPELESSHHEVSSKLIHEFKEILDKRVLRNFKRKLKLHLFDTTASEESITFDALKDSGNLIYVFDYKNKTLKKLKEGDDGSEVLCETFEFDFNRRVISKKFHSADGSMYRFLNYDYSSKDNFRESTEYFFVGDRFLPIEFAEYDHYNNLIKKEWGAVDFKGHFENIDAFEYDYDAYGNWIFKLEYNQEKLKSTTIRDFKYY